MFKYPMRNSPLNKFETVRFLVSLPGQTWVLLFCEVVDQSFQPSSVYKYCIYQKAFKDYAKKSRGIVCSATELKMTAKLFAQNRMKPFNFLG